jgi:hypothetical protein
VDRNRDCPGRHRSNAFGSGSQTRENPKGPELPAGRKFGGSKPPSEGTCRIRPRAEPHGGSKAWRRPLPPAHPPRPPPPREKQAAQPSVQRSRRSKAPAVEAIRTSPRRNGTRAIAGKVKSPRRRRLSATGLDRPWSRRGARRRSEAGIKPALSLPPAIATMTKPKIIFSCDVSPKRQGGQNCGSVVSLASKTRRVDETVSRGYSEHHGEQ